MLSNKLWPPTNIRPMMRIYFCGRNTKPARQIMLKPNAHITCKPKYENAGLKNQAKFKTVNSRKTSHRPLFKRNADNSFLFLFSPYKKAEVPASKTNVGAQ